jgi:hypothetical protein
MKHERKKDKMDIINEARKKKYINERNKPQKREQKE